MSFDLHNDVKFSRCISPMRQTNSSSAVVSEILDTAGFAMNEVCILTGSLTDANATFAVLLEEGDAASLSDNASVADADMYGTEALAAFAFGDDDEFRKLGYKGVKRYLRLTITPTSNDSGNLDLAAVWVQSGGRKPPFTSQG